jgi:hypothetical protein
MSEDILLTDKNKINYLIKSFDGQIKKEYKIANGDRYKCTSYWSKNIFLLSINLTIADWKKIRSDDYWITHDCLDGIEKSKFIFNRIKTYLNK